MMKETDWRMAAFVGLSLLMDYLPFYQSFRYTLPKVQYWNGERELSKKRKKPPFNK